VSPSVWQVTSSRVAYENVWIRVVEDEVITPSGSPGLYGVVELRQPAVFVVAVNADGDVLLETVDRHTVGPSVEVPAGGSDGEDLLVAAQRELYEETGYVAASWRPIGTMRALNGVCRAPEHVFLAQDLTRVTDGHDAAVEGISAARWVPWSEVMGMVSVGRISDGETIACLLHAAIALGKLG
jgi:8-oxo-dGTP pyrophosphatase MutT (NUDIX family)